MKKLEADKILMALDGLAAYLETIRNLVISQIDSEVPPPTKLRLIDMISDEECLHENFRQIDTLGESIQMCDDCGKQF